MSRIGYVALGIAFAVSSIVVPSAISAAGYGMAGCGLGSLAFKDNKMVPQILASTTNGIYYNQMFAITSGTSNCAAGSAAVLKKEQQLFVRTHMAGLEVELAAGKGERLDNLARLMGCPVSASKDFSAKARTEYGKLLSKGSVTPHVLLGSVRSAIGKDKALSRSCTMANLKGGSNS